MTKETMEIRNDSESSIQSRAFQITPPDDMQLGLLCTNLMNHPVAVTGQSWLGFTIRVPEKLAKKLSYGKFGRLRYQGDEYKVQYDVQEKVSSTEVDVSLLLTDESYSKHRTRKAVGVKSRSIQVAQKDSVFSAAVLLCFLLILLALPGWGDQWGTSHYFDEGCRTITQGFYQALQSFTRL